MQHCIQHTLYRRCLAQRLCTAQAQARHLRFNEVLPHRPRHRDAMMTVSDIIRIANLRQRYRREIAPAQFLQRDADPAAAAALLPGIELSIELVSLAFGALDMVDINSLDSGVLPG